MSANALTRLFARILPKAGAAGPLRDPWLLPSSSFHSCSSSSSFSSFSSTFSPYLVAPLSSSYPALHHSCLATALPSSGARGGSRPRPARGGAPPLLRANAASAAFRHHADMTDSADGDDADHRPLPPPSLSPPRRRGAWGGEGDAAGVGRDMRGNAGHGGEARGGD
eukprot:4332489-Pyramimonas_sp.AAC.2